MIQQTETLTLVKTTITQGTGGDQSIATATVQTLKGSLQPISQKEVNQYGREAQEWDWKFFVEKSQFTSTANEAELKAKNYMTQASPSRTFDIIGFDDWTNAGGYYKVRLKMRK